MWITVLFVSALFLIFKWSRVKYCAKPFKHYVNSEIRDSSVVRSTAQNTCRSCTALTCKLISFLHPRSLHVKQSSFLFLTLYVSFPCVWVYLIFKPASLCANVKHFCLHADCAPNKPMTLRQTQASQAGLLQYHENPLPKDISHTSIFPSCFLFLPQLIKEEPRILCWPLPPN